MTEAELRHAVGDRVYDAFAPHGLLYNHDAEDPDDLAFLGTTDTGRGGRDQQAGRRERPARLRQHQPRRDGRRLEVAPPPACASYRSLRHHHNVAHHAAQQVVHGPATHSELHSSNWRMGKVHRATPASRSSRSRRRSTTTRSHDGPMSRPAEARVGVDAAATGPRSSAIEGRPRPHAGPIARARSSSRWQAPHAA